jgi:hypothetical protein
MPQRERYLLQIWRSRALSGWQWAARLDRLSDGEQHRFTDPEALLNHLQSLVQSQPLDHRTEEKGAPWHDPDAFDHPARER